MLLSLKINDVAIIEEANIRFEKGLNIMTGETGSGKSIIIDSINAILGERTSKELIRDTAECAKVTAVFDNVCEKAERVLKKYDIECEDNSILVQRTIKEGRNICRINGETVTASVLKEVGKYLININGQNDSQALLNEDNHIFYLDLVASNDALLSRYKDKYYELKEIYKELKALKAKEKDKEIKLDTLRFQIDDIKKADIKSGEREKLLNLKKRLQNEEKVKQELQKINAITNGNNENGGITSGLYEIIESAKALNDCYGQIDEMLPFLEQSLQTINELTSFVTGELLKNDNDNIDINTIEERLDVIYRLSKKYGESEDEILNYLEKIQKEYDSFAFFEENTQKTQENYNRVLDELLVLGKELTDSRKKAGELFAKSIEAELAFLNMNDARFCVEVNEKAVTSMGLDEVRFMIATNKGQSLKPLIKTASGGELSRIMLAIKCVLMNKDNVDTMIFDEIDTGVSGRAAEKIGVKLHQVSKVSQVICVTHLAQIASYADNHLYIEKIAENQSTKTHVRSLGFEQRKEEIARIMSGSLITEATLLGAEELMKKADSEKN